METDKPINLGTIHHLLAQLNTKNHIIQNWPQMMIKQVTILILQIKACSTRVELLPCATS
jgi:hypothetical protein